MKHSCTIILVVDNVLSQEITLYQNLFQNSGVNYELFTCSKHTPIDSTKLLSPNLVFGCSADFPKTLNTAIYQAKSDYILFLDTCFIAPNDWLKAYLIALEKSEANCLIAPYLCYLKDFSKSEYLNPFGEILNTYIAENKPNDILGVHIFNKNVFYSKGGFVGDNNFTLNECLIHYRKKLPNIFIDCNFLKVLKNNVFTCEIKKEFLSEMPLREFSHIEEIAFHNLPNFLHKVEIIHYKKFMLPYVGKFGFRCGQINSNQLKNLMIFCTHYNLQIEICTSFPEKENQFSDNLIVLLQQNK